MFCNLWFVICILWIILACGLKCNTEILLWSVFLMLWGKCLGRLLDVFGRFTRPEISHQDDTPIFWCDVIMVIGDWFFAIVLANRKSPERDSAKFTSWCRNLRQSGLEFRDGATKISKSLTSESNECQKIGHRSWHQNRARTPKKEKNGKGRPLTCWGLLM